MRKMLAVVAMLLVAAGSASAQGGGRMGGMQMTPEARDSVQFSRLFDGITLNASQTTKAKEIITATRVANSAIAATDSEAPAKRAAGTTKRNADLKALLTSDADKTKFDENAAAAGRGRRGGGL